MSCRAPVGLLEQKKTNHLMISVLEIHIRSIDNRVHWNGLTFIGGLL